MVCTLLAILACFSTLWRFLNDLWTDICFIYKLTVLYAIRYTWLPLWLRQWVIKISGSVLECTKLHIISLLLWVQSGSDWRWPFGTETLILSLKNPLVLGLRNWDSHYQWIISTVRENLRWGFFFLGYWPQLVSCCWCYFCWFFSPWRGRRFPCHTSLTLFIQSCSSQFSRWGTWDQPL